MPGSACRGLPRRGGPQDHRDQPGKGRRWGLRGRDADRGSSALEFAGMLPLLLLVALAAIQLGIVGYAVQQAGTGARAAARLASREETADRYAAGGRAAMSDWTAERSSFTRADGAGEVRVTATVSIPSLLPGMDSLGSASRSATMPSDRR
ncbi:TadE/TadG family type IV pilus assembly protein [Streptomyces sp. AA1529]|uniref:TadE/TadG family type IV pilus assembly protein n=1 Tax=Streptomyces sp. AA1529 TaxID=1203257 RepID=UPI000380C19B|nr:TadE/TadG family type IV pilus assembly protein [Streptomyces sp. AA1529]